VVRWWVLGIGYWVLGIGLLLIVIDSYWVLGIGLGVGPIVLSNRILINACLRQVESLKSDRNSGSRIENRGWRMEGVLELAIEIKRTSDQVPR
jgi:hypothetical protein